MKIIVQSVLLLCSSLCLFSCAEQRLSTPSGRPEVTVKPSMSRAQSSVIRIMTASGYTLGNQSTNAVSFEREMPIGQSVMVLAAVGNSSYSHPKSVIQFTFVPSGTGTRIMASEHAVTQGPFGQVSTIEMTGGNTSRDLQKGLEIFKQRMDQR